MRFKDTFYYGKKAGCNILHPDTGEVIIPKGRAFTKKGIQAVMDAGAHIVIPDMIHEHQPKYGRCCACSRPHKKADDGKPICSGCRRRIRQDTGRLWHTTEFMPGCSRPYVVRIARGMKLDRRPFGETQDPAGVGRTYEEAAFAALTVLKPGYVTR